MIASILNPGPSVKNYRPTQGEFVVGVNRAAGLLPCSAWACGDPQLLTQFCAQAKGQPSLLTSTAGAEAMRQSPGVWWAGEVMTFEQLRFFCDPVPRWDHFTSIAAIVYAVAKGAKRIICWGMDWEGTKDFDGWDEAGNRSEDRWKLESGIFHALQKTLMSQGIEVSRVHV